MKNPWLRSQRCQVAEAASPSDQKTNAIYSDCFFFPLRDYSVFNKSKALTLVHVRE